jgi:hypothetical protein
VAEPIDGNLKAEYIDQSDEINNVNHSNWHEENEAAIIIELFLCKFED